jgi:hypothetical protein
VAVEWFSLGTLVSSTDIADHHIEETRVPRENHSTTTL